MEPQVAAQTNRLEAAARWMNRLFAALVVYASVGAACMLTGVLGPTITHYVGLTWALPASLSTVIICGITARCAPPGDLRRAWISLTCALALYFAGECIGASSWLRGVDPFPGPADFVYCGFYLALPAAAI
ncbi:MAG TPA: hypothetical protein VNY70_07490, partial [Steroidobacteraceae bacterium]|nr:hypothetical protein [Steroidobacteraceae bacterium]